MAPFRVGACEYQINKRSLGPIPAYSRTLRSVNPSIRHLCGPQMHFVGIDTVGSFSDAYIGSLGNVSTITVVKSKGEPLKLHAPMVRTE